jgi:outer membrane lipoprotein-sorting protein
LTLARRTTSIRAASLIFLLSCAAGCAARPKAIAVAPFRPLRAATLDEVLAAHERTTEAIETLSAAGSLQVRDLRKAQQRQFGVRVLAGRGGRLYLKASVAVVTALEAVSDGQTFWFQVPSRRSVWTGASVRPARLGVGDEPYEALRPADLTAALLPEPLRPSADEALVFEGQGDAFSLSVVRLGGPRGHVRRRVWLARDTLLPMRACRYDEQGDVQLELTFAGWSAGVPRRLSVARPHEGYEARFDFERAEANVTLDPRLFSPRTPADYKVITIDEQ